MNKALVIFNPTAGLTGKADTKKIVLSALTAAGYEPELILLDFDFEDNFVRLGRDGIRLVVAVGGDGTVKVAAREIIKNQLNVPLLIVPFGSANVFASSLDIPMSTMAALDLLKAAKTKRVDVGLINDERYFIVGFSLGYVSKIIISTEKQLKNRLGSLGYVWRLFWNKFRITRIKFRIETDNHSFWVKGNSLVVLNALRLYGFTPKKTISLNDGILNLFVVTNKTFLSMIEAAFGALLYAKPPRHFFIMDNKKFIISVRRKKYLKTAQIDGDRIKLSKNIKIEVLPGALAVMVK